MAFALPAEQRRSELDSCCSEIGLTAELLDLRLELVDPLRQEPHDPRRANLLDVVDRCPEPGCSVEHRASEGRQQAEIDATALAAQRGVIDLG
ncbi:MAG: hypothetical protein IPL07_22320 [Acidimicrobiaceae bacterium]|nr:hypothetical protein [Acidimicrobiaceae bacterium]